MKNIHLLLWTLAACTNSFAAGGADQIAVGKVVFDRWCAACHAALPFRPGTASLAVKYGNTMPAALEERTNLPPAVVSTFVRYGVLSMPSFRKTEITDAELEALGAYLGRNTPK